MPYHYTCPNPQCLKPFVSPFRKRKYCSVSCASAMSVVETEEAVRQYFLDRVTIPTDPLACWPWHGSLTDQGYPMAFVRRKKIKATRLSYELFVAPIPEHLEALHDPVLCTSRACTNFRHLRPGTHKENMDDRVIAGTLVHGSKQHRAVLTEGDVLQVLQLFHRDHLTLVAIADQKKVDVVTIFDIIHRKSWKHVAPGEYPAPTVDRRTTRPFKHDLPEVQVHTMCLLRYHENLSFYAIGKRYGIDPLKVQRIYARWLKSHP